MKRGTLKYLHNPARVAWTSAIRLNLDYANDIQACKCKHGLGMAAREENAAFTEGSELPRLEINRLKPYHDSIGET